MKNFLLAAKGNKDFLIGNYYPALDGLRGLAILLVILYHNFDFLMIFRFGWIGVDLFFVLSGFLITGILLKKRDSDRFLRNFYARRILRILPIYYLGIFVFLFILPRLISYPFNLHYFIENQCWFWLEIQNWLFILKPRGNNNFLNHLWSLALEEQFYLFSPWIIIWIKQLQKIISFLLIVILLLTGLRIAIWLLQVTTISYIELFAFTRIDGLCVGSILAIFSYHGNIELNKFNKSLFLSLFILVFVCLPIVKICYLESLPFVACCLYPGIAVFWGCFVWLSTSSKSVVYKVFNNRPLIFFGKISYGLYLFHWPVGRLLRLDGIGIHGGNFGVGSNLLRAFITTAIAVMIAVISYYTFEKHFIRLKKHFI